MLQNSSSCLITAAWVRHKAVSHCGFCACRIVIHLCPVFRQQVLQSLDDQNAEAALFSCLHLSISHRQSQLNVSAGTFGP